MSGEKEYEYRSWSTDYRGDLLICSTKNPTHYDKLCGFALCVVKLVAIACDNSYWWNLGYIRLIKPFPIKGQQRLFEVEDKLIEYL